MRRAHPAPTASKRRPARRARARGWLLRLPLCLLGAPLGAAAAEAAPAAVLESVTVTLGRGAIRSVQGVGRSELESASLDGRSPLAAVARLPGVNFQSADALGQYEWSVRFSLRGFAQSQLGFTLDGVPLGDMSYGNLNGLHISRAIASENLARAELSQGSGALDTPSSSNLGGTVQFFSADPAAAFGLRLAQTLGSHRNLRTHWRLDSGETPLGALSISLSRQRADKWKGEGEQRQDQLNLKLVKRLGPHRLSAFLNTSDRQELDYQDLSLEQLARLGWRWDNFFPDFDAALRASTTLCGNGGAPYVPACDDAYYAGAGLRKDRLAGATLALQPADGLRLTSTVYAHRNDGRGLWYTPYTASPDGTPLALRTTEYALQRRGLRAVLDGEAGAHQLRAALWREHNEFEQARRFYATPPGAVPSPYRFPRDPFLTQWQVRFRTETTQLSVADTVDLSPDLRLHAGFKALSAETRAERLLGSGPEGRIRARHGFLPQLGLVHLRGPSDEWFASVARNLRAFQAAATGSSPFATTQAGFDAIQGSLRPERSMQLEAGWRTVRPGLQASLSAYAVDFRDRLLSVTPGAAIQGNPSVLANVGGVRGRGLEGALSLRLRPALSAYASLSFNRSVYRDDVVSRDAANQPVRVATAGKTVVDAPRWLAKGQLRHDDGRWFAELDVDAQSRRYYSYVNDASVPGRVLLHLSTGLRLRGLGPLQEATLRLGVHNLTQRRFIATLGSNDFVNSDPGGTAQTLLPGAPRQGSITLSARL